MESVKFEHTQVKLENIKRQYNNYSISTDALNNVDMMCKWPDSNERFD